MPLPLISRAPCLVRAALGTDTSRPLKSFRGHTASETARSLPCLNARCCSFAACLGQCLEKVSRAASRGADVEEALTGRSQSTVRLARTLAKGQATAASAA
jgi:hypothetical protein